MNLNNIYIGNENGYQLQRAPEKDGIAASKGTKTKRLTGFLNVVTKIPIHLRNNNKSDYSPTTSATEEIEALNYVSFAPKASARSTLSRDSYTKAERNACWFTEEEFSRMKKGSMALVAKMDSGSPIVKKYCTRGLEKYTRILSCQRLKNRFDSINAVLDEQEMIYLEGHSGDDERIATVYSSRTAGSQLWANVMGLKDQKEAEKYL